MKRKVFINITFRTKYYKSKIEKNFREGFIAQSTLFNVVELEIYIFDCLITMPGAIFKYMN